MDLETKAEQKESELAVAGFDLHGAKNQLKDAERNYYRAEGAVLVLRELQAEGPAPKKPPSGGGKKGGGKK